MPMSLLASKSLTAPPADLRDHPVPERGGGGRQGRRPGSSKGSVAPGRSGEVVVVDNGSTDASAEVATAHGAIVVSEPRRGYGSAYLAGLEAARGEYVVMGDADDTYPLDELARFVERLEAGDDLVIGSRFEGTIHGDAMPFLNRFVGNPILTGMLNVLFGVKVSDAHCGMRAVRREALARARPPLDRDGVRVRDGLQGVPPRARPSARCRSTTTRASASRSCNRFGDAWRHVRFMLLYSPSWLYLVPGSSSSSSGSSAWSFSRPGPIDILGHTWQIHTMLGFVALTLIGAQVIQLGVFARTYARVRIGERDRSARDARRGTSRLEHGLLFGSALALCVGRRARSGRARMGVERLRRPGASVRDGAARHRPRARYPDRLRRVLPRAADHAAASRVRRHRRSSRRMISVVIPVKDGGADLVRCLEAIAAQQVDEEVEVVVIDSGPRDGSAGAGRGFGAHVHSIPRGGVPAWPHAEPRRTARERRHLVFTSQDAYAADTHWLARLTDSLGRDDAVAGVYGRQLPHADARPPERYFLDFLLRPCIDACSASRDEGELSFEVTLFSNVNSALPRSLWEAFPVRRRHRDERGPGVVAPRPAGRCIVYEPDGRRVPLAHLLRGGGHPAILRLRRLGRAFLCGRFGVECRIALGTRPRATRRVSSAGCGRQDSGAGSRIRRSTSSRSSPASSSDVDIVSSQGH